MKRKKIEPKFVTYTENPDYRTMNLYGQWEDSRGSADQEWDDLSNWNIDEKYKEYSEFWYPQAKLTKNEYKRLVKKALDFQRIGRKLTDQESKYLFELWRALEPLKPKRYLSHLLPTKKGTR